MPEYYIPQIKVGMDILKDTRLCIFVDAVFRKCSLEQLNFNNQYDTNYHYDKFTFNQPLCFGIQWIVAKRQGDIDYPPKTLKDFGKMEKNMFDIFLYDFAPPESRYEIICSPFYFDKIDLETLKIEMNNFIEQCNKFNIVLIGYLPYKLFKTNITLCQPEPGYILKYKNDIIETIDVVNKCLLAQSKEEKIQILDKHYPKKIKKSREKKINPDDSIVFSMTNIMELMSFDSEPDQEIIKESTLTTEKNNLFDGFF
jgi:hypothetical protein